MASSNCQPVSTLVPPASRQNSPVIRPLHQHVSRDQRRHHIQHLPAHPPDRPRHRAVVPEVSRGGNAVVGDLVANLPCLFRKFCRRVRSCRKIANDDTVDHRECTFVAPAEYWAVSGCLVSRFVCLARLQGRTLWQVPGCTPCCCKADTGSHARTKTPRDIRGLTGQAVFYMLLPPMQRLGRPSGGPITTLEMGRFRVT